jgi:hypothetical protein
MAISLSPSNEANAHPFSMAERPLDRYCGINAMPKSDKMRRVNFVPDDIAADCCDAFSTAVFLLDRVEINDLP